MEKCYGSANFAGYLQRRRHCAAGTGLHQEWVPRNFRRMNCDRTTAFDRLPGKGRHLIARNDVVRLLSAAIADLAPHQFLF
jgi:hypothetical protein